MVYGCWIDNLESSDSVTSTSDFSSSGHVVGSSTKKANNQSTKAEEWTTGNSHCFDFSIADLDFFRRALFVQLWNLL